MKKLLLVLFILSLIQLNSKEMLSEDSEYIDVYLEKRDDGGYDFYADNRHFIPQFISLGFVSLTNLTITTENPSLTTLKPGDKRVHLTSLVQKNKKMSYSFKSRLSYTNGDPETVNPDNYLYYFPFSHGDKYKLDQGYGGKFSHKGENYYALDFSMDIGTPVLAARDGIVIETKEDSNRRGTTQAYAKYGNYIAIYHSDGTFASYVHLRKNGVEVEVGDRVEVGELIGYSGNTGLTTGPHLHFSVNIPSKEGVRESIPILLKGLNNEAIDPKTGTYYYSYHDNGEDFEALFGKDLVNEDFKDHSVPVENNNKLEFRSEEVDDTVIIYCKNGKDAKIVGRVLFVLQNGKTSKDTPIEVEIPPLTESFICLVKPIDSKKPFKYSYSIRYQAIK